MSSQPTGPVAPGRRYSTFVGIAFLALIAIATLNTIGNQDSGLLGTGNEDRGMRLLQFAVPNARTGPLDKDANVIQRGTDGSGQTPACEIDVKGAIRVCDLFDRPLVLSFWFTKSNPLGGTTDCAPFQDTVDRVSRRYRGRVNFLSIDIGDDPTEVRRILDERGWMMPVGYDRDGTVGDLIGIGGCPALVFAYPGGVIDFVRNGRFSAPALDRDVKRLLAQSARRAKAG